MIISPSPNIIKVIKELIISFMMMCDFVIVREHIWIEKVLLFIATCNLHAR